MKSFHLLSKDQTGRAGLKEGEATALSEGTSRRLKDFFAREKATTVTIGALHPDPHTHVPNFGRDFLYFTTDAGCMDLEVTMREAPVLADGLRMDAYRCIKGGAMWRVEMISSSLNQKRSLAHLYQPESQPMPLEHAFAETAPPHATGDGEDYTPYAYNTPHMSVEVVPVHLIRTVEERLSQVEQRLEAVQTELTERTAERDAARLQVEEAEEAVLARDKELARAEETHRSVVASLNGNLTETIKQARDAEVAVERQKAEGAAKDSEIEQLKERVELLRVDARIAGEKHAVEAAQLKKEAQQLAEDLAAHYKCEIAIARLRRELEQTRAKVHEQQSTTATQAQDYDSRLEQVCRDRDRIAHEVTLLKDRLKAKDYEIRLEKRRANTVEKELKEAKRRQEDGALTGKTTSKSRSRSAGSWRAGMKALPQGDAGKEDAVVKELNRLLEKERTENASLHADITSRDSELRLLKERYNHAGLALVELQEKEEGMARKFLEADAEHEAELTQLRGDLASAEEELKLRRLDNQILASVVAAPVPVDPLLRLPTDRPDMIGVVSPPPHPAARSIVPSVLSPPVPAWTARTPSHAVHISPPLMPAG